MFQTMILASRHAIHYIRFEEIEARQTFEGKRPPVNDEKQVYRHSIDRNPELDELAIPIG